MDQLRNAVRVKRDAVRVKRDAVRVKRNTVQVKRNTVRVKRNTVRVKRNAVRVKRNAVREVRIRVREGKNAVSECQKSLVFGRNSRFSSKSGGSQPPGPKSKPKLVLVPQLLLGLRRPLERHIHGGGLRRPLDPLGQMPPGDERRGAGAGGLSLRFARAGSVLEL